MATGRLPDPNTAPVTAKGDLYTYSTVPAKLAVGNNGETLVADSAATTGLRWSGTLSASNPVLNSAMDIWQRGTSFTANYAYTADRWQAGRSGGTLNISVSRQTTGDTTNLPFIQYCARVQRDSGVTTTNTNYFGQNFESVNSIPYAGKSVTVSFYARAGANFSSASSAMTATFANGTGTDQNYLTGGYTNANTIASYTATLTTTWQRFSFNGTVPTNSTELAIQFSNTPVGTAGAADFFEITGVQIDVGSVALPFRRAMNTLAGELAACQRYYYRVNADNTYAAIGVGMADSTSNARMTIYLKTTMRTTPTVLDRSGCQVTDWNAGYTTGTFSIYSNGSNTQAVTINYLHGSASLTQYRPYMLVANANTADYIGLGAEL